MQSVAMIKKRMLNGSLWTPIFVVFLTVILYDRDSVMCESIEYVRWNGLQRKRNMRTDQMQIKKNRYGRKVSFILMLMAMMILLCGCGHKAAMTQVDADCGVATYEPLLTMQEEMYQGFINRRFIVITDDAGVLQYVKVDNSVGRHNLDLSAFAEDEHGYKIYAPGGTKQCKIGIDVSKHNKQINWQKVKNAGIDFAFLRLGYRGYGTGKILLDECFDWNMSGTLVAGIPRGVYFYSQAISYEEGVEEANFVLQHLKGAALQYPVVLDTEDAENADARTNDLSVEQRTQACIGFCETIKAAGYDVMVYANKRWFALDLDVGKLKEYKWWYAQYADTPAFPYRFSFWQYSAKGKVDGISGDVDMNIEFIQ